MEPQTRNKELYWHGRTNKFIRLYFYSQRGLALFNEFRYVFMLIFGLYVILKLSNPIWIFVMFLVICPILVVVGWIQVHRMAKVIDWLNIEFASHWSRYGYELQERQNKILTGILKSVRSSEQKTI